jgi:catechol 2,3-dioxygenase-like lactoylglutathione lyase family enzyme
MDKQSAYLSHIVIHCFDFDAMLEFYTKTLGFHLSDLGTARGNQMAFITLDPSLEHHQLALVSGRTGSAEGGTLNHIAFGVKTLAQLKDRHEHLKQAGVKGIELWTHASMLSVYYRDPENNRLEFFLETPYYVKQPVALQLDVDLHATEEEVWRFIEDKYGKDPSFKLMSEWKAETARKRAAQTA